MRRICIFAVAMAAWGATPAHAALLRPFSQIATPLVHLTDLFDDLGNTPDRVLGHAPAPGERIKVQAPQLAAIARDFNVAWRPQSGAEQVVIERRADILPQEAVMTALRAALMANGASENSDIAAPGLQPILVPLGTEVKPEISQCSFDVQTGRFTAMVSVAVPDMPILQQRVSGQVVTMVATAVAVRFLQPGHAISAGDIKTMPMRQSLLHGDAALLPPDILGMSVRHTMRAGQPVSAGDLERTTLIARGTLVHMTLTAAGIVLGAQGIAAEAGALGERIKVENPISHQMVLADIIGPGEVRVAPKLAIVSLAATQ